MNAKECYEAGQLADAVAAAGAEVKAHPTDASRRGFLCELLCFAGDLERADKQLDAMGTQDPEVMVGVAEFRQLLRAELTRREFFNDGRLPEFLHDPPEHVKLALEASIRIREGKEQEAVDLLGQADEKRPALGGTSAGEPFDGFRDLDDLTGSVFEVLTSNGKYYWVPMETVERIEFHEPQRPRDLLWRRALLAVRDGPDGEVCFPTLYHGSHEDADQRVCLGRFTDWRGGDERPVRGFGQRTFLIGEQDQPILELGEIVFA